MLLPFLHFYWQVILATEMLFNRPSYKLLQIVNVFCLFVLGGVGLSGSLLAALSY